MKKLIYSILACVVTLVSCAPMTYVLPMQSRKPSTSGLDFSGKSLALIYLEDEDKTYSAFNNTVADALAYSLELDYFDGDEGIRVYNLPKDPEGDYASVDTVSQYVLLLDSDVIMILDTPETDGVSVSGKIPFVSRLYVYDSMGEDKVTMLQCKSNVSSFDETAKGVIIGNSIASPLVPEWEIEPFSLYYFDDSNKWTKAIDKCYDGKWADAIDIWMEYVKSSSSSKASSACYNIATGCFFLGQYELATQWLDMSDKFGAMALTPGLRKRIEAASTSD